MLEQKDKRSSLSQELSIPCIVKQPKQPEVKGIIKEDKGDRITKKSRYIPNRLVTRVQRMEAERTPVKTILKVLAGKNKRSKK